jgi:hypothetical protein
VKHDDGDDNAGWRLFGVEDRRFPVRRGTPSDLGRHGRSSSGVPTARVVHRQRPRDLAGPSCNFVVFLDLPVRTVF